MVKIVPKHLREKAARCIFCDEPGLTKTHIFPDWLAKYFPATSTEIRVEGIDNVKMERVITERKIKQGGFFKQRPYLACGNCNSGWMKSYEDQMVKFAIPIFTKNDKVKITSKQIITLSCWVSLITILAEYHDKSKIRVTIGKSERDFLKNHGRPPHNFSIFLCSLNGSKWKSNYTHFCSTMYHFNVLQRPIYRAEAAGLGKNTQVSSFGIGNLFFHVFSCPFDRDILDFCAAAKATGLVQLWPRPFSLLPFYKRSLKLPTKLVLTDETADEISNAFADRIRGMEQQG